MTRILILYYSHGGSVAEMAKYISRGVESIENCEGSLRTVPPVRVTSDNIKSDIPESGPPFAIYDDLINCDGLALGSPTRFGNMAAPIKYFIGEYKGFAYTNIFIGEYELFTYKNIICIIF